MSVRASSKRLAFFAGARKEQNESRWSGIDTEGAASIMRGPQRKS